MTCKAKNGEGHDFSRADNMPHACHSEPIAGSRGRAENEREICCSPGHIAVKFRDYQ